MSDNSGDIYEARYAAASEPSSECLAQLDYINQAAHAGGGNIQVPVTDEDLIAEIREHCPPDQLKRCCFGVNPNERGAVG